MNNTIKFCLLLTISLTNKIFCSEKIQIDSTKLYSYVKLSQNDERKSITAQNEQDCQKKFDEEIQQYYKDYNINENYKSYVHYQRANIENFLALIISHPLPHYKTRIIISNIPK